MPDDARRPSFARGFPEDAELDALVEAFASGNYARVRAEAPALAERTDRDDVRAAARLLRERLEPDPLAKSLLLLTAALLVGLSFWFVAHPAPKAPPEERRIEVVK